jgi:hypothetical protein
VHLACTWNDEAPGGEHHRCSDQGLWGGRWGSRSPDLHGVNVALFQLS